MKVKGMFLLNNGTDCVAILMHPTAIWKRSKLLAMGFRYMGKATGDTDQEVKDNAYDHLHHYFPQWITFDELTKG